MQFVSCWPNDFKIIVKELLTDKTPNADDQGCKNALGVNILFLELEVENRIESACGAFLFYGDDAMVFKRCSLGPADYSEELLIYRYGLLLVSRTLYPSE